MDSFFFFDGILIVGSCANVRFRDIGTAEAVLGPVDKLPTPFEIPW